MPTIWEADRASEHEKAAAFVASYLPGAVPSEAYVVRESDDSCWLFARVWDFDRRTWRWKRRRLAEGAKLP